MGIIVDLDQKPYFDVSGSTMFAQACLSANLEYCTVIILLLSETVFLTAPLHFMMGKKKELHLPFFVSMAINAQNKSKRWLETVTLHGSNYHKDSPKRYTVSKNITGKIRHLHGDLKYKNTIFTISIWTERPKQTVQTQIRCHRMWCLIMV